MYSHARWWMPVYIDGWTLATFPPALSAFFYLAADITRNTSRRLPAFSLQPRLESGILLPEVAHAIGILDNAR
jgi:hypothetical protein